MIFNKTRRKHGRTKHVIGCDPAKPGGDVTASMTIKQLPDGGFKIETIFTNPNWVRAMPPESKIAKINRRILRSLDREMKRKSHA